MAALSIGSYRITNRDAPRIITRRVDELEEIIWIMEQEWQFKRNQIMPWEGSAFADDVLFFSENLEGGFQTDRSPEINGRENRPKNVFSSFEKTEYTNVVRKRNII